MPLGAAIGENGRDARREVSWAWNHSSRCPPRVLVAGRLQCGTARAAVRRGHGDCAELAHLARGSSKFFTVRLDMLIAEITGPIFS